MFPRTDTDEHVPGVTPAAAGRMPRSHVTGRPGRRRRRLVVAGVVVAAVVGVVAWLVVDTWRTVDAARSDLARARTDMAALVHVRTELLTPAGRKAASAELAQVARLAGQARSDLAGSTGLDVLGVIPYLHTQRQASIQLADDVSAAAGNAQQLLGAVDSLAAHSNGTTIGLADLSTLQSMLGTALPQMTAMERPSGGLIGPLAQARQRFDKVDAQAVSLLAQGRQLVNYALPFLGADGPRTYLLACENNAEMRDQGSVLSYAVLSTDAGTYTVTDASSVGAIRLTQPVAFPLPPGTQAIFGGYRPTLLWQSTNATADFPLSGADMQAMFEQATGVKVDGVIAVDVPMLARLLRLTGPVTVNGIAQPITAGDVTAVLLHDLYVGEKPGTDAARKDDLAAVFKAVVDQLRSERVDPGRLAQVLAQGVATRELLAWDSDPAYERTITTFHASGAIDDVDPTRAFHVAVENATATKLDYYVRVAVSMNVAVTKGNHAVVDTTVTVVNDAPAGRAPSYQLGPDGVTSHVSGQYVANVYLYSPRGSDVEGGTPESGLVLSQRSLSVLPQQRGSVQFQTVIPDAVQHGRLTFELVPQPRLQPDRVTVKVSSTSWLLDSAPVAEVSLSKPEQLRWLLSRP